jgi:uncharacterized protein (DUF3820 family)
MNCPKCGADLEVTLSTKEPRDVSFLDAEGMRMPWGKHKGELIEDIPAGYLRWALDNAENLKDDLREEIENQLSMKHGRGVPRGKR